MNSPRLNPKATRLDNYACACAFREGVEAWVSQMNSPRLNPKATRLDNYACTCVFRESLEAWVSQMNLPRSVIVGSKVAAARS